MATRDRYHVLLVDNDPADAGLTAKILEQRGIDQFVATRVATFAEAATRLACFQYDAVLLDMILPDVEGLEAVKGVLTLEPEVPLLVLGRCDDERLALEAVMAGAQDYLIKQQGGDTSLRRAVRHAIERKRVECELRQLAKFDLLTGLPNRQLFHDRLEQAVRRIDRAGLFVAVIFVDLDGFKGVNDRHGHATGDHLLKAVAGRLRRVVRRSDTVARLGGDEFTIILEGLRHTTDAARVAEHALVSLRQPFELGGIVVELSASLGVAIASHPSEVPDALTHRADVAMYRAKARGGTSYQFDAAA